MASRMGTAIVTSFRALPTAEAFPISCPGTLTAGSFLEGLQPLIALAADQIVLSRHAVLGAGRPSGGAIPGRLAAQGRFEEADRYVSRERLAI